MIWQKIGKQIKEARKQKDWSQADLGAKIGSNNQFVSNLEHARQKCSIEKLDQIATALECELIIELRKA